MPLHTLTYFQVCNHICCATNLCTIHQPKHTTTKLVDSTFVLQAPGYTRLILGLFSSWRAPQACRYKDGTGSLTDYSHVWILPSYYDPSWWKLSEEDFETLPSDEKCSNEEMEDILTSVLFVGSLNYHFGSRYPEQGTSLDVVCISALHC